jgi:hypothetical protein
VTQQTVTFDDQAGQNQVLNGQYPSGIIDWGTNQWYLSGPYGQLTTKSVSFNGGTITSATFSFVSPRRLVQLDAYNGGTGPSTVSLTCAGQPTKQTTLGAQQLATVSTGWTGTCGMVTVSSTNGWDTNFDTLVLDGGTTATVVPTGTASTTPTPTSSTTPTRTPTRTPASATATPTATRTPTNTPMPTRTPVVCTSTKPLKPKGCATATPTPIGQVDPIDRAREQTSPDRRLGIA